MNLRNELLTIQHSYGPCDLFAPPQAIRRLELDNLAEIENSVENEMGYDDYHKHMTIAELRDNFAGDI